MRKLLTITVLLSLFAMPAMALDFTAKQFFVQGVVALPMGDFGDGADLGYGGGLGMMVPHNDMLSFGLEASYLTYSMNEDFYDDASFSMIPVLAMVHYDLSDAPVYLLGGLGLAFGSFESNIADDPDTPLVDESRYSSDDSSSDVAIALGAGFDATPNMFFEGRLMLVSDANQITGHIGYRF